MSGPPVVEVDLGPGVRAGFTGRDGGCSPDPWRSLNLGRAVGDDVTRVSRNRRAVELWAGAEIVYARQVHGRAVHVVGETGSADPDTAEPEADALVAVRPAGRGVRRGVAVLVADCVPVLLADPVAGVVAAVHAGRQGLTLGVVDAALDAMADAGAAPERLRAAIGPAVCGRCYEVPEELRAQVAARHPEASSLTSWGTPALDLPRAVAAVLSRRDVSAVLRVGSCTMEDPLRFSHRLAAREGGPTGRSAGVITLV